MTSRDHLFDVSDDIAVITGVAGQLGARYAMAFLERGARVVGLDVAPSVRSEDLGRQFPDHFGFFESNVGIRSSLESSLSRIVSTIGIPTVLVNNAAIDSPPGASISENGPYEDFPESSWSKVLDVNLKGVHLCCQVFGSVMANAGNGSIINIGSIYGMVSPDQSLYEYRRKRGEEFFKPIAYSVSKGGLLNLTRYLAVYWAKKGVRVNSLTLAGVEAGQDAEFLDAYCGRIPIGRMASVDEYCGAVLFLASRASRYMTGANLVVDGGWTAI